MLLWQGRYIVWPWIVIIPLKRTSYRDSGFRKHWPSALNAVVSHHWTLDRLQYVWYGIYLKPQLLSNLLSAQLIHVWNRQFNSLKLCPLSQGGGTCIVIISQITFITGCLFEFVVRSSKGTLLSYHELSLCSWRGYNFSLCPGNPAFDRFPGNWLLKRNSNSRIFRNQEIWTTRTILRYPIIVFIAQLVLERWPTSSVSVSLTLFYRQFIPEKAIDEAGEIGDSRWWLENR